MTAGACFFLELISDTNAPTHANTLIKDIRFKQAQHGVGKTASCSLDQLRFLKQWPSVAHRLRG